METTAIYSLLRLGVVLGLWFFSLWLFYLALRAFNARLKGAVDAGVMFEQIEDWVRCISVPRLLVFAVVVIFTIWFTSFGQYMLLPQNELEVEQPLEKRMREIERETVREPVPESLERSLEEKTEERIREGRESNEERVREFEKLRSD